MVIKMISNISKYFYLPDKMLLVQERIEKSGKSRVWSVPNSSHIFLVSLRNAFTIQPDHPKLRTFFLNFSALVFTEFLPPLVYKNKMSLTKSTIK